MSITMVWSASELEALPEYYDGIETKDPQLLAKILWKHGIDVKTYTVTIEEGVNHRNRHNKIVNCKRFIGTERSDSAWKQSGYISTEALIDSDKDKEQRKELLQMSARAKVNNFS